MTAAEAPRFACDAALNPLSEHNKYNIFAMPPTQPGVYLYEDSNFGGASKFFTQDCPNLVSLGFNDKTSSIRVIGPYSAIVFGDVNYGGWAYT